MKLQLPKVITYWISIAIAAVGVILYIVHLLAQSVAYLQPIAFLLVVVAFVLLCLGLNLKGL